MPTIKRALEPELEATLTDDWIHLDNLLCGSESALWELMNGPHCGFMPPTTVEHYRRGRDFSNNKQASAIVAFPEMPFSSWLLSF